MSPSRKANPMARAATKANNEPKPRAKALPPNPGLVGYVTVTREGLIHLAVQGKSPHTVEAHGRYRTALVAAVQGFFGPGGILRRSKQSTRDAHVYLVFR